MIEEQCSELFCGQVVLACNQVGAQGKLNSIYLGYCANASRGNKKSARCVRVRYTYPAKADESRGGCTRYDELDDVKEEKQVQT